MNDADIAWAAGLFEGEGCLAKGAHNSIRHASTSPVGPV